MQTILHKQRGAGLRFLAVLLLVLFLTGPLSAQVKPWTTDEYEVEWVKVDALVDKGLPKSAIEEVKRIQLKAREEGNSPQYIKCVIYAVKLNADFEESTTENSIAMLSDEIKKAKSPAKQIFHSILAELYWSYYQSNRNDWLERKETKDFENDDIKTWDLKKLVNQVIMQYRLSLTDSELLKATSLKQFDILLQKSEKSKQFRPTLYDFLAHRAVDFFMEEETYLTKPVKTFYLDNKEYLAPAPDFALLKLQTPDSLALKFYALNLLQDLVRFHFKDNNPAALIDVELKRLSFVKEHAIFESKDSIYLSVLKGMTRTYSGFQGVTDIHYKLAQEYIITSGRFKPLESGLHKWDCKIADSICNIAISAYPTSDGAVNCKALKQQIRERQLQLVLEYGNVPGKPFLGQLKYKNVSRVSFRVVKVYPEMQSTLLQRMDAKQLLDYYLAEKVVKTWNLSLPEDADLQNHTTEIKIPALDAGFYVIVASSDPSFAVNTEIFTWTPCWITTISYVDAKKDDGGYDLFVLDRNSGKALANVKVTAYTYEYDNSSRSRNKQLWKSFISQKDGSVNIPGPTDRNGSKSFYLVFESGNEQFISDNYFYLSYYGNRQRFVKPKAYIFTDRAIYRPGQIVYFKAIILEGANNKYELKPGFPTFVSLIDVNGKKLSSLDLQTNDFGSVSGSFSIPVGLLNGTMMISTNYGSAGIRVEEYKRPKYEVKFDAVSGSYKLGEKLTVKGKAMAYTGNPVPGATVKYRVVRMARFPFWVDYRIVMPVSPETEISDGIAETDANGGFEISFIAASDKNIQTSYKPVFTFRVFADVTDLNGETHSSDTQIHVGLTALNIRTSIPENVNAGEQKTFTLHSENLNGVFEPANGIITISRLIQPEKPIKERRWERPDKFTMSKTEFLQDFPNDVYDNENDRSTWVVEKPSFVKSFNTSKDSTLVIPDLSNWIPGTYCIEIKSIDKFGQAVEIKRFITLFSLQAGNIPDPVYHWLSVIKDVAEPGENALVLFGSKAKKLNVLYEVSCNNEVIIHKWLKISNEQLQIDIPIKEEYRGNIIVSFLFVYENRSYANYAVIKVPFSNKDLEFKFATLRDHLLPGDHEKMMVTISGKKSEKILAETMFTMYDASLDVFAKNKWEFQLFRGTNNAYRWLVNDVFSTRSGMGYQNTSQNEIQQVIRGFDMLNWFGYQLNTGYGRGYGRYMMDNTASGPKQGARMNAAMMPKSVELEGNNPILHQEAPKEDNKEENTKVADSHSFENVELRSDFRETAFFYPDLRTNEKGEIILEFTMPDALTRWNLMGLAHKKDLMTGTITKELVTRKDLMVFPNLPRFVREGDTVKIGVKIVNMKGEVKGVASLEVFDALTMQPLDNIYIGNESSQSYSCIPNQSTLVEWIIRIPDNVQAVMVRTKASSGSFTDGEETSLPVLSNRTLVTEALSLPVNGNITKTFTFNKLKNPTSSTLRNYRLSLEFTSNPIWYAVQALPYIMETQQGSTEELFNKLFANSLGTYVAMSNPKIQKVFESWKLLRPSALLSNLEKNEELKNISLQETPWVMDGKNESERKQRVALLFDFNRMEMEQKQAIQKLIQLQLPNGGWPWFPGLPDNRFITQYILTGMGRMEKIGLNRKVADKEAFNMVVKACHYMDQKIREDYENLIKYNPAQMDENHVEPFVAQYLYGRSFYLKSIPVEAANKTAYDYYLKQINKYWTSLNPYLQAMAAISLNRSEKSKGAGEILRSLREKALHSDEMGMYWREVQGYSWHERPIQAQSLLIEAFDEINADEKAVNEMKKWLLKQKQTQDWKSTVATADACYALLRKGSDLLESQNLAEISIGGQQLNPASATETRVEAGTGYFKTSWTSSEIKPEMGDVKIVNKNESAAWGAMYWQYFEQLEKITSHQSPLSVSKQLFLESNTESGPVIRPLTSNVILKTGDKVTVRIVLKSDRNLEFVHLKDMRAAGFEPVNVLSGYKYQDGLSYYETTSDAATNFYFPDLQKGTYVFEYTLIASVKGAFSNGISMVQCLYAPEFSAHSEGVRVKIQ